MMLFPCNDDKETIWIQPTQYVLNEGNLFKVNLLTQFYSQRINDLRPGCHFISYDPMTRGYCLSAGNEMLQLDNYSRDQHMSQKTNKQTKIYSAVWCGTKINVNSGG